jgi:alcohol dehydrogenase (NADP+)
MSTVSELPTEFLLNNGLKMAAIGLGTFQGDKGNGLVKEIVITALKKGYRHIDTASGYGNEKEIGDALLESGIAREEIFVTTKL